MSGSTSGMTEDRGTVQPFLQTTTPILAARGSRRRQRSGEAPGRARLRPNRGFPPRTRLRRNPLNQSFEPIVLVVVVVLDLLEKRDPSGQVKDRPILDLSPT